MPTTDFVANVTDITAAWLDEVDAVAFQALGDGANNPPTTPAQVRANLGLAAVTGAGQIGYKVVGGVDQTVEHALRGQVANILDYGGDPTGAGSSSAALLAAVRSLSTSIGGTVYFPPGNYYLDATTLPFRSAGGVAYPSITLAGAGRYSSNIYYYPATGTLFSLDGDLDYYTFCGLGFHANNPLGHTVGWMLDCNGGTYGNTITVTNVSKETFPLVTGANSLNAGNVVHFGTVTGMTELSNRWAQVSATNLTGAQFRLINPNSTGLDSTTWGVWTAGNCQVLTAAWTIRDLFIDNCSLQGFYNNVRMGAAINCRISRGRWSFYPQAGISGGISIQVGDAGHQATSTCIEQVYQLGYHMGVWNKWCNGLQLDEAVFDNMDIAIQADAPTVGTAHIETSTNGLLGPHPVNITALNSIADWGNVGPFTISSGQYQSKIRHPGQPVTLLKRTAALTFVDDGVNFDTGAGVHAILFTAAEYDGDSLYDSATGKFTATVPGLYEVDLLISIADSITQGTQLLLYLTSDGSSGTFARGRFRQVASLGSTYQVYQLHGICQLEAGEYIQAVESCKDQAYICDVTAGACRMTIKQLN